mmetsp:Transcript_2780/g.7760  ORF Transcript_2780/g.7760 Transcript_2780/m.7760 type:complete len:238 (+) Transcript_2780:697-1410(+)
MGATAGFGGVLASPPASETVLRDFFALRCLLDGVVFVRLRCGVLTAASPSPSSPSPAPLPVAGRRFLPLLSPPAMLILIRGPPPFLFDGVDLPSLPLAAPVGIGFFLFAPFFFALPSSFVPLSLASCSFRRASASSALVLRFRFFFGWLGSPLSFFALTSSSYTGKTEPSSARNRSCLSAALRKMFGLINAWRLASMTMSESGALNCKQFCMTKMKSFCMACTDRYSPRSSFSCMVP